MQTNTLFTELTTDEEANLAGGGVYYSSPKFFSFVFLILKGYKKDKDDYKGHGKHHHKEHDSKWY